MSCATHENESPVCHCQSNANTGSSASHAKEKYCEYLIANHDICSIDNDNKQLKLEVKACEAGALAHSRPPCRGK